MSLSNATLNCLNWMQNQVGQSPCTVAQEVGQQCKSGYTVSVNNFQEIDYVPTTTTANGCTCSWSMYNLMSACTFCVGKYQYPSWSVWTSQCGSHGSNTTYFPSKHTLSQGIPYWAATNPSTWTNATFNATEAADAAAISHQDVTGAPLPNSSTSNATDSSTSRVPVGAIIGGVAGAVAIFIVGGLIFFCTARRRRRQTTRSIARPSSVGGPFFDPSRPVTPVPAFSHWDQTTAMPVPPENTYGGPISPFLAPPRPSTSSMGLTSPIASPISSGFYSNEYDPFADMSGMKSPFLAAPPAHQISRSKPFPSPASRVAELQPDRKASFPDVRARLNPPAAAAAPRATEPLPAFEPNMSFPEAHSRLNPPPYAAVVSEESIPMAQMSSEKREKWNDNVMTAPSEQSHVSTPECMTPVLPSPGRDHNPLRGLHNR